MRRFSPATATCSLRTTTGGSAQPRADACFPHASCTLDARRRECCLRVVATLAAPGQAEGDRVLDSHESTTLASATPLATIRLPRRHRSVAEGVAEIRDRLRHVLGRA